MLRKPQHASEYRPEYLELVRATCLYVATKLGDVMDEIVVIGGLVPSLLIHLEDLPPGTLGHAGTTDLDVGLTLALLDAGRYRGLTGRLRDAGFTPDVNEEGRLTRQRWRLRSAGEVTIDFLIPPSTDADQGGTIRNIESDFAAIIAPGLALAFEDRDRIGLDGRTILGERATRGVWVCGPGAFVVLKALAFDLRGENKDAYDLFYMIRNYGKSVEDVVARLRPLLTAEPARRALVILRRDFQAIDGVGPRRVADFLLGAPDDAIQADVVGFVGRLLDGCATT
jgi:hypothetical protein